MVNTRKKGKKQDGDSAEACQAEVVDLSEESETSNTSNSVRRSTRRSSVGSKDPISTPIRRSRRLSNSSVESVTIDSPIPVSTRRSIRGKHTASVTVSDSEDGDLNQASKKRKVTDLVDTLSAIDEEKTESEVNVVSSNPVEIIDLELKEISSLKREDDDFKKKSNATDSVVTDIKANEVQEDNQGKEQAEPEVAQESCDKFSKEDVAKSKEKNFSHGIPVQEINTTGKYEKEEELKESTDSKEKENLPDKSVEFTKDTEDSKLKSEKIVSSKPLKKKQKTTSIGTSKPQESEINPLPCGAEIMKSIPRGRPKSGRLWKDPKSNPRYMYKDKGLKMPFEKITQLREERRRVKELENRMKEEERLRRDDLKRRKEINKQRQEENAKKGEIVQVIRNTGKLKRMSKKQLRQIQKRDTATVK